MQLHSSLSKVRDPILPYCQVCRGCCRTVRISVRAGIRCPLPRCQNTFAGINIKRIGDYAENITEYAQYLKDTEPSFSEKALGEIRELRSLLGELYEYALKAYNEEDFSALGKANIVEEVPMHKMLAQRLSRCHKRPV